jgi:hypothetical protein
VAIVRGVQVSVVEVVEVVIVRYGGVAAVLAMNVVMVGVLDVGGVRHCGFSSWLVDLRM